MGVLEKPQATFRVFGEGTVATVDLEPDLTPRAMMHRMGTTPREKGWDLFLNGALTRLDAPIDHTRPAELAWVPRTRGG